MSMTEHLGNIRLTRKLQGSMRRPEPEPEATPAKCTCHRVAGFVIPSIGCAAHEVDAKSEIHTNAKKRE